MLKYLAISLNIMGSLFYFLGFFTFVYWLLQWLSITLDFALPSTFVQAMDLVYGEPLSSLHSIFGTPIQKFGDGQSIDMSLCILVLMFFTLFMVNLMVATAIEKFDQGLQGLLRSLEHQFYLWKVRKIETDKRQEKILLQQREHGAIVAIQLDNTDQYSDFEFQLLRHFANLPSNQLIVDEANIKMVRLDSTKDAMAYTQTFRQAFLDTFKQFLFNVDVVPTYRMSVQCLLGNEHENLETAYLRDLLKCTGPNQVYVSAEAKGQIDFVVANEKTPAKQTQKHSKEERGKTPSTLGAELTECWQFVYAGTYYRLGHRSFAEAYKLGLDPV